MDTISGANRGEKPQTDPRPDWIEGIDWEREETLQDYARRQLRANGGDADSRRMQEIEAAHRLQTFFTPPDWLLTFFLTLAVCMILAIVLVIGWAASAFVMDVSGPVLGLIVAGCGLFGGLWFLVHRAIMGGDR